MSFGCTSTACGPPCSETTDVGRLPRPPVQKTRNGFRINLDMEERELIHRLLGELRSLLTQPDVGDERLRRLFPTAYHERGDREYDEEFRRLMRDELINSRMAGLDLIAGALAPAESSPAELTEAQMMAFLQALNGIRLVLGTMLDVTEDHDIDDVGDDHPMVGEYHLYNFLSWVLDSSVRAVQS